jgi:hypothetical protein
LLYPYTISPGAVELDAVRHSLTVEFDRSLALPVRLAVALGAGCRAPVHRRRLAARSVRPTPAEVHRGIVA